MSDSDEFDHYLSDNDLDFESINLLEQSINSKPPSSTPAAPLARNPAPRQAAPVLNRAPLVQARPAPIAHLQRRVVPTTSSARPSGTFLRPPKPPPRQPKPPPQPSSQPPSPAKPVREEEPPPPKRRRVSLNEKGQEGFVDPNPFNSRANGVNTIKEEAGVGGANEEYVEEDMPEIRLKQGKDGQVNGYEVEPRRGTTVLPKGMRTREESVENNEMRPSENVMEKEKAAVPRLVRRVNGNGTATNGVQRSVVDERQEVQRQERDETPILAREGNENRVGKERQGSVTMEGKGGMSAGERRELEELRRERAKLQAALQTSEQQRLKISEELLNKAGESSVVRNRMNKAEAAHAAALKEEQRERERLAQQLREKEQDFHNQMEKIRTAEAFRKLEQTASSSIHTSARKSTQRQNAPGSTQRSASRGLRGESVPAFAEGGARGRHGESPSLGRSRGERASSARPSQQPQPRSQSQAPAFAGFHNSFADSPARPTSASRTSARRPNPDKTEEKTKGSDSREREGSMAPPPFPMTAGKSRKNALKSKVQEKEGGDRVGKGKERMRLEEDESFFSEGHGGEVSFDTTVTAVEQQQVLDGEEDDDEADGEEGWDWDWVEEEREWRGEILAAVFSHTTFAPIDTTLAMLPAGGVPSTQLRSTFQGGSTSRSFAYSNSASTWRSTLHASTARSSGSRQYSFGSASSAPSSLVPAEHLSSTGPSPTFHSLMNLRFPPTLPPTLNSAYESATRDLFTLLGRRLDPRLPQSSTAHSAPYPSQLDHDPISSALHLCSNLSTSFTTLLSILDQAGLVGPLTALLSLINHLAYLFPLFAKSILDGAPSAQDEGVAGTKGGMIGLLGKIISRYGKPAPAIPALDAQSSASKNGRLPFTFHNRRSKQAKTIIARDRQKRTGENSEERVIIEDKEKRESLLNELATLLECLAWRWASEGHGANRNGEEQFVALLKTPNTISTLLDPTQPTQVLLSSSRFLALLAARPGLYRPLLALKLTDSSDVRNSPLPIYDRIATLLNQQRDDDKHTFDLHSALLVLSTSLLTHQADSLRLVAESPRFIPEGLLKRIYSDVERLWEWDGRCVERGTTVGVLLQRTTQRLFSTLTLLYYLLFSPHSSLALPTFFRSASTSSRSSEVRSSSSSQQSYVQDWCFVALGTLAFSDNPPSWAEPTEKGLYEDGNNITALSMIEGREGEEAARLTDMKYLAQEILEEMLPEEIEGIGECFGVVDDEDEVDENEDEDQEEERVVIDAEEDRMVQ